MPPTLNLPSPSFTFAVRPPHALRQFPARRCLVLSFVFKTRAKREGPEDATPFSSDNDDDIATKFARFIAADPNLTLPSSPSPLLSPTNVCRALCSALQRPDCPEAGSGLQTAFSLTLPHDVGPGAPVYSPPRRARSWNAAETFLALDDFLRDSLSAPTSDSSPPSPPPAGVSLLECDSWELAGDLAFTGRGSVSGIGDCSKAAQAVNVTVSKERGSGGGTTSGGKARERTVTILLSRVDEPGPWKGCWMVYGVRAGNYSL